MGASGEIRHDENLEQLQLPAQNYRPNNGNGNRLIRSTRMRLVQILGQPLKNISGIELFITCLFILEQKRGLWSFNDKPFLVAEGVLTLAYGHHAIQQDWSITRREADRSEQPGCSQ